MKCSLFHRTGAAIAARPSSFSNAHGIPYTEIDVDANPAASAEVMGHVGKRAMPQLVIDGEWFQPYKPGRGLLFEELHQRLGIPRE